MARLSVECWREASNGSNRQSSPETSLKKIVPPQAGWQLHSDGMRSLAARARAAERLVSVALALGASGAVDNVKKKGGFAIECDHGGGHMIPSDAGAAAWKFMQAHPFKTNSSPYASGLPAAFPSYCKLF